MVDDEFDYHLKVSIVRSVEERFEISDGSVTRVNIHVVRDVITVITERRRKERQQPDTGDTQILEIVQFLNKALEVSDPITIAVGERLDVEFIDNGIFEPQRI